MIVESHLSYSQAATATRCARQWYLNYVVGERGEATGAMSLGRAVDDYVTARLRGEYVVLADPSEAVPDAEALWAYASGLDVAAVQAEHRGRVEGVSVPVVGYSDVILEDGTVVDWKRSRAWNDAWKTQLSVYHLIPAESIVTNGQCRVVRVWGGKTYVYDFRADVDAAANFLRAAWAVTQAATHPAEPGQACSWCRVAEWCRNLCREEAAA